MPMTDFAGGVRLAETCELHARPFRADAGDLYWLVSERHCGNTGRHVKTGRAFNTDRLQRD